MSYNCGRIFFFYIRLWTVRLLVQVFTLARGGCNNHRCHNKTPDGKWDWGVNNVMPGSDGLGFLVILKKKAVSWDSTLGEVSWDSDLGEASPVVVYGMCRVIVGSVSWALNLGKASSARGLTEERCRNSQHNKNCVSLSSCRKTKSKNKVDKRFAPELPRVVRISMHMNILCISILVAMLQLCVYGVCAYVVCVCMCVYVCVGVLLDIFYGT